MPIHIWMPIKLLCPCCDALPVVHVKQKGPLSSSVFITLFSLSFIHVLICSSSSCCCGGGGWGGGSSCPRLAQNGSYLLDASAWFLLIWPKLAQKTPPTTHPLISNDRLSLNIGINYGDVKFGSHRGAVFRANKKKNPHHWLWTSCLWILLKLWRTTVLQGLWCHFSLPLRSAGV